MPRSMRSRRAGALPAGLDRAQRHGRAAARCRAWRSRDQRGDGAGQARGHQSARAGRADRRRSWRRSTRSTAAEIAGPGFINLRLTDDAWRDELRGDPAPRAPIMAARRSGAGATVNVEYVSANPTGPMHMGHCRGAVVGDALASLLEFAGHKVIREYYVNDAGGAGRYARPLGAPALPRGARRGYRRDPRRAVSGRLSVPVGQALAAEFGDRYRRRARERMARPVPQARGRGDDGA